MSSQLPSSIITIKRRWEVLFITLSNMAIIPLEKSAPPTLWYLHHYLLVFSLSEGKTGLGIMWGLTDIDTHQSSWGRGWCSPDDWAEIFNTIYSSLVSDHKQGPLLSVDTIPPSEYINLAWLFNESDNRQDPQSFFISFFLIILSTVHVVCHPPPPAPSVIYFIFGKIRKADECSVV